MRRGYLLFSMSLLIAMAGLSQAQTVLIRNATVLTVTKGTVQNGDVLAIEQLIGRAYEARTPKTLTTLDALMADIGIARNTGVAYDREEHTLGICAVGVALDDPLGSALAISVPVPSQRFNQQHALIAERLLATKSAMQADLSAMAA